MPGLSAFKPVGLNRVGVITARVESGLASPGICALHPEFSFEHIVRPLNVVVGACCNVVACSIGSSGTSGSSGSSCSSGTLV